MGVVSLELVGTAPVLEVIRGNKRQIQVKTSDYPTIKPRLRGQPLDLQQGIPGLYSARGHVSSPFLACSLRSSPE